MGAWLTTGHAPFFSSLDKGACEMKKNRMWLILAVVCLVLGIAAVLGNAYLTNEIQVVEKLNIVSSGRNRALAYDEEKDILYIGTQEGTLEAFHGEDKLWSAPVGVGAYSKIVFNEAKDKLYTSNEGQHIYVFDATNGALLLDIPVMRVVVGIAVNNDESKIAVATNTGKNKSNLLVYSADGEELYNKSFSSTTFRDIEFCDDGVSVLVGNKKGYVVHYAENGEELDKIGTNYDVVQMKKQNGLCYVLSVDGSYHILDGNGQVVRNGKFNNDINAAITALGTDATGEHLFIGSSEGYVFVLDANGQELYREKYNVNISDTAAADGQIYFTAISGEVYAMSMTGVALADSIQVITLLITILSYLLILAAIVFFCMGIPKIRAYMGKLLKKMWQERNAYLFLLPTFVILFFFTYRPIFTGLTRAFTNWSKLNNTLAEIEFVGLDNFVAIFQEGYFLIGLKNLCIILASSLIKNMTVPLLVAWLIYNIKGDRRKYLHRFLFVLPIVVPGVVSIMMWQRIYDPMSGLINNLLELIGRGDLGQVWLGNPKTAIWAVIFVGFPFIGALPMLIYYGALGNISDDIMGSALIDGANKWDIFWKIQLPIIRPQILLMVMLTFIGGMQDYGMIYILTGGGPGTSTYVPALELYFNVQKYGRYAYASAMGIILMIFTLVITLIFNKLKGKED